MRSEAEIRQKLKQVCYRHLQKILRNGFKKLPQNCTCHSLQKVGGQLVGVCRAKMDDPYIVLCDAGHEESLKVARECPVFEFAMDKEKVKAEFKELMGQKLSEVAAQYPDVAALRWVLGEGDSMPDLSDDIDIPMDGDSDESSSGNDTGSDPA